MAIYLDNKEKQYLKKMLADMKKHRKYLSWIHDKILEKVQSDIDRIEHIKTCEHNFTEFVETIECCCKCGGMDVGMKIESSLK